MPDEALEESFDDLSILTIVEWPERLAEQDMPADGLICRLCPGPTEGTRLATLSAIGPLGERCLSLVRSLCPPDDDGRGTAVSLARS